MSHYDDKRYNTDGTVNLTPRAPMLTPKMAAYAQHHYPLTDVVCDALQALATGRTAVAHVLSEEECRAEFEAWWRTTHPLLGDQVDYKTTNGVYYEPTTRGAWNGWLASRRAAGLVAEKQEG